jgi:hypothetical protein
LRAQIMLGMTAVTLVAILTTGYIALWASGDSLRLQRESMSATLAAAVARSVAAEWATHAGEALPESAHLAEVARRNHECGGIVRGRH